MSDTGKLPSVGDVVEVYREDSGWVRTSPIIRLIPASETNDTPVGFIIPHPHDKTNEVHVRYEANAAFWRWPPSKESDDKTVEMKEVLPVVGDVVEIYGEHRGWVRTEPVATLWEKDGTVIGFAVAHPDSGGSSGLYIRYDGNKVKWRWPLDGSEVNLCHDCIGAMLRNPERGGFRPTVTSRGRGVLACAHKPFVVSDPVTKS